MASLKKFLLQLTCCLIISVEVGGYVYDEEEAKRYQQSDDSYFAKGQSYRIRNRRSKLYMTDVSTQNPYSSIQQWPLKTGKDRVNQVWYVIPSDNDGYLIANKGTGQYIYELHVKGETFHGSPGLALPTTFSDASERWAIHHAATSKTTTKERFYTIKSRVSQWYLLIAAYRTDPGSYINCWPLDKTLHLDSQQWAFEVEDNFLETVNRSVADIGHILNMTGWQQSVPSKTHDVLIGQLAIPFPLIADPVLSRSRQSILSPFYFLRRYSYWQAVTYHRHSGTPPVTLTTNVKLGLITNNAKAMGVIAGLCVTAESSLCLKGSRLTFMIAEIANGLKINVDEDSTEMNSKTMLLNRKYVTLKGQVNVLWFREDRYVLERMDGDKMLDWVIRVPTTISDGYQLRSSAD